MKKFIMVIAMVAIIGAGTAFADHPDGLGIGVQWGGSGGWDGGFGPQLGATLSLKVPALPVYWAIDVSIHSDYFGLGVSGDVYFIDSALVPSIGLNWYLGFGVGVGLGFFNSNYAGNDVLWLGLSARLPVGLSLQLPLNAGPLNAFEIYLQLVPSIGVKVAPEFHFPYGGWGFDLGIRLWL